MRHVVTGFRNRLLTAAAALAASLACTAAHATLIDLTGSSAGAGSFGNTLAFSADGINVTVSAFGETGDESPTGSGYYLLQPAQVLSFSTGLGVCNQHEGIFGDGCLNTQHEVDTINRDDLVVFVFDQTVNFERVTVDPFNSAGSDPNDRDIVYWVGSGALPNLTVETFDTLGSLAGFTETTSNADSSFDPYTHALSGIGNILLLAGEYFNRDCKEYDATSNLECESYKIKNIKVSVVPLPAALPLLLSAFAGLGLLSRRRRYAAA